MSLLRRSKSAGPSTRGGTGRTIARRSGKALLGLVLVLALLAGVGAVYQAVVTGRAQRAQPAPGASSSAAVTPAPNGVKFFDSWRRNGVSWGRRPRRAGRPARRPNPGALGQRGPRRERLVPLDPLRTGAVALLKPCSNA